MDVPRETPERGELKRPRLTAFAAIVFAIMTYLYFPTSAPRIAAPTSSDCVELQLWTNGFHSDLSVPASIFPADHPLRRLYPNADSFLIGWGEEAFFRSDVFSVWRALDALVPPSPSVAHVAEGGSHVRGYLGANLQGAAFGVSAEGAAGLVAYVDSTLALGPDGGAVLVTPGKVIGHSSFLRARGSFHLFNVCNQWMARAIRAAGLNVNARAAWMGDWLLKEVRRERPGGCSV